MSTPAVLIFPLFATATLANSDIISNTYKEGIETESTDASILKEETNESRAHQYNDPHNQPVLVEGHSRKDAMERSAYAVDVVDTADAKQKSADLGDLLARETAVSVQRAGGLGSRGSYSLGGLGGERLRFFVDGVPLEYLGFSFGVGNVPVNLVDRIEVYQGVVPIQFGADALSGAVHLVTDEDVRSSRASASYQLGSFETHRATLSSRYYHAPTHLFARASVYVDVAENNYPVDVEVYDAQGRISEATLPRFHDGYRGVGTNVGAGITDQNWADRFVVQAFVSDFEKEVQNGATMARPYGDVDSDRSNLGANIKYSKLFEDRVQVSATGGYVRQDSRFTDISNCLYDWYGRCTPRFPETVKGEMTGMPLDREQRTDTLYFRSLLGWNVAEGHKLRLSISPTYSDRRGRNALLSAEYDPLREPRRLGTAVFGTEYELSAISRRLQNIAFVKAYGYSAEGHALLATGQWQDMSRTLLQGGGGDGLRFDVNDEVFLKASYEYATRLPTVDELFGDGALVLDNLNLVPETSHNLNFGIHLADWASRVGHFRASATLFAREARDLVTLVSESDFLRYVNVFDASVRGLETSLGWTIPRGDWLSLDARVTYQDARNRSSEGPFEGYEGDRIPNTPSLQSAASARLRAHHFIVREDTVDLTWSIRYVQAFLRGWESAAQNAERLEIPDQTSQGIALLYSLTGTEYRSSASLEVQNLTDERIFDFYGVQRPGRSFFTKWTLDY